jgi:hypothetical protein
MVNLVAGRETDDKGISIQDTAQFWWERPVSDTLGTVGTGTPADSTPPNPIPPAARITDGERLFTLDGRSLTVVDASGPAPRVTTLKLPALTATRWDSGLLLGDRLLAIASGERNHLFHSQPAGSPPDPIDYRTHLALVDLSRADQPVLLGTEAITGWVVTAQSVDHRFRVVLSTSPDHRLDHRSQFLLTSGEARTFAPTAWLPDRQIRDVNGTLRSEAPLLSCSDVWAPAADAGLDVVSTITIDPSTSDPFRSASAFGVVAGGGIASATNDRVYIASARAWGIDKPRHHKGSTPTPTPPLIGHSSVHEFDVSTTKPVYRGSVGIDGFADATGSLSARQGAVRLLTSDTPPWRFDVLQAKTAHHAVTVLDTTQRLAIRGRTTLDMPARTTSLIRWFDDLLAVAAQRAPNGQWGSDEKSAGPLRWVALPDLGPPKDLATLDLPGDEADLFKVDAGRLGAVGMRAKYTGLDPNSVEMYSLDLHDPAAPALTDAVSYGNGENYAGNLITFGHRRLLTSQGWITAYSRCPARIRCVNHPLPPCRASFGCTSVPRDKEVNGLLVDEIGADGRLHQVAWLLGVSALAAVGERLVAIGGDHIAYLDPHTFKPLVSAEV